MPMKRLFTLLGVGLGLSLLFNLIAGVAASDQWTVDAASAECQKQGWRDADLVMARSNISGGLLGKTVLVEFESKDRNQPKHLRVTRRKPLHLVGWRTVDYQDSADQP
jgi:hypothetical protein